MIQIVLTLESGDPYYDLLATLTQNPEVVKSKRITLASMIKLCGWHESCIPISSLNGDNFKFGHDFVFYGEANQLKGFLQGIAANVLHLYCHSASLIPDTLTPLNPAIHDIAVRFTELNTFNPELRGE